MKPITFKAGSLLFGMLILGITIILTSWDFKQTSSRYQQSPKDTVPDAKHKKIVDLDDVLDELNAVDMKVNMEKAQREIEEAMKKLDVSKLKLQTEMALKEVDMEKVQKELKEAMKNIDADKLKMQAEMGLKEVDMEKLQKEIKESMDKFDGKKIKEELANALKEIDAEKMHQQMKAAMESIDLEKMKVELDKVKDINTEKLEKNMKDLEKEMSKLGPDLKQQMEKAKLNIEKAKDEIKEYRTFIDGLNADGLIDKKGEYSIKHKDGELIINGKKVSTEIYTKYRNFLEKHKKFNIEKSDDDFNIHKD